VPTQPFETIAGKYSSSNISLILLIEEKMAIQHIVTVDFCALEIVLLLLTYQKTAECPTTHSCINRLRICDSGTWCITNWIIIIIIKDVATK